MLTHFHYVFWESELITSVKGVGKKLAGSLETRYEIKTIEEFNAWFNLLPIKEAPLNILLLTIDKMLILMQQDMAKIGETLSGEQQV